jgi:hypothetical protein
VQLPFEALDRMSLLSRVRDIGKLTEQPAQ